MSDSGIIEQRPGSFQLRVYANHTEYYIGSYPTIDEAREAKRLALEEITTNGAPQYVYCRARDAGNDYDGDEITWFFDSIRSVSDQRPECRLRFAIIVGAILDLYRSPGNAESRDARRWITGNTSCPETFTFEYITEMFGLNTKLARRRLLSSSEPLKNLPDIRAMEAA